MKLFVAFLTVVLVGCGSHGSSDGGGAGTSNPNGAVVTSTPIDTAKLAQIYYVNQSTGPSQNGGASAQRVENIKWEVSPKDTLGLFTFDVVVYDQVTKPFHQANVQNHDGAKKLLELLSQAQLIETNYPNGGKQPQPLPNLTSLINLRLVFTNGESITIDLQDDRQGIPARLSNQDDILAFLKNF